MVVHFFFQCGFYKQTGFNSWWKMMWMSLGYLCRGKKWVLKSVLTCTRCEKNFKIRVLKVTFDKSEKCMKFEVDILFFKVLFFYYVKSKYLKKVLTAFNLRVCLNYCNKSYLDKISFWYIINKLRIWLRV